MRGSKARRKVVHADLRQSLAEYAVDVQVERDARRCIEQVLQSALIARGAEPAPVPEQMHIGAQAGETSFLDRDDSFMRPLAQRVRLERPAKSIVMSLGRLGADAAPCALPELSREAWSCAAFEPEQSQAQRGLSRDIAQRLAHGATRGEGTVQAPQFLRLDGVGAQVFRRRRFVDDPKRNELLASPQTLIVRREQRFDELRLAQQRAEFTRGLFEFDANDFG